MSEIIYKGKDGPSNAAKAAKRTLGSDAKRGLDFEVVKVDGGAVWRTRKLDKAASQDADLAHAVALTGVAEDIAPATEPQQGTKVSKKTKPTKPTKKGRTAELIAFLRAWRTSKDVAKEFGWLEHTARAAISTLPNKTNVTLDKQKRESGGMHYRIA